MRRLALILLLLWLPLHWSWAAGVSVAAHPAAVEHQHQPSALEPMADAEEAGKASPAAEQEEDCSLCQAADWQAALPTMPQFAAVAEAAPPFDDIAPFDSFVPPVPEPPARLALV